jgi:hypothetical protein
VPRMFRGLLRAGLPVVLMLFLSADAFAGTARLVTRESWTTRHAYGLTIGGPELTAHPEWQLRDGAGNPLRIGSLAAADFGSPAFRSWWIAQAQAQLAAGSRGLFIDDVQMERRTTLASGTPRNPVDPRTGFTMSEATWQRYMADFMVQVRAALPNVEIVHDVLWYMGDLGVDTAREIGAANYVNVDVTTPGIGWQTFAGYVDRVETFKNVGVIFDGPAAARLYTFAMYLLMTSGRSALSIAPGADWPGYDADLGPIPAHAYVDQNVWRRDFSGGIVLANEVGRPARTITLPGSYRDLDGVEHTSVTLAGGTATVLTPVPVTPPPPPVPPVPPAETNTAAPVPPVRKPTSGGSSTRARISNVGHRAGARGPGATRTSVRASATKLSGTVSDASGGSVRLVVERRRGSRWAVVRRVSASVHRHGTFWLEIARLPHGTYRVRGSFLGTGTSLPSRSAYRTFHA